MRNYTLNNFDKYSVKKFLDGLLYLIYVSWSASPKAYLIVYMLYTY